MSAETRLSVAVIVPAYKEEETILELVKALLLFPFVCQVVVVDDSPDTRTVDQLAEFQMNSRVTVIHRRNKGGRGSAVREGLEKVLASEQRPDVLMEMDSDFSHPPSEIPAMLAKLSSEKADLVIASRYLPQSLITDWPLRRRLFSWSANRLAKALLRIPVSDYTNGFRAYSQAATRLLLQKPLLGTGFIALSDSLVQVHHSGLKVTERPTVFRNRIRGASSLGFAELRNAFVGLFRVYLSSLKLKRDHAQAT